MRDGNSKLKTSERKDAERKRLERDRMRDAGFKWFQHWVHEDDAPKVKKLAARLLANRKDSEEE